ncbi:MAG: LytTR family DNA-binding domain-containing protein [Burkholderiaceae bacterium]|jgi:DNA-binding LytR/AlgR family response regulator
MTTHTALVADDEPLLREVLLGFLSLQWPELRVVAQARNGLEAVEQFEATRPTVCFLDIHMPGLSGVEVAQRIGGRAHVVFITAFDHYALQAFEHGALDYLVKPLQAARLAGTLARLRERLRTEQPVVNSEALLAQLAHRFQLKQSGAGALRWIRASVGSSVRLIPVDDIDYLKSDEKYTLVAWRGDGGKQGEAFIRTPLKGLVEQLDPQQFQQIHRSVVVNLNAISHVTRGDNETADVFFKNRSEVLPVSRTFLHLFKAE